MAIVIILNLNSGSGNQTWVVPSDWNSANNTIEVIGGGGSGAVGGQNGAATGGGGGGYAKISNLALTVGASVTYNLGGPGQPVTATAATAGNAGGSTWFNGTTQAASSVAANGGGGGVGGVATASRAGGAGASTTGAVGTTLFAGGNGGAYTTAAGATGSATGGGGAAGLNGAGGAGVAITGSASGQASAGGQGDSTHGGAGGAGVVGSGGGAIGSSGTEYLGYGNNGTTVNFPGGSGGGSGGSYFSTNTVTGGNAGFYGGGGGGAVTGAASTAVTSGAGRQGLIIITYTPNLIVQPPFWAPRPAYDEISQMLQPRSSAIEAIRIAMFGAAGQVPTRNWSAQLSEYDDPPMWVGRPLSSATMIANQVINPIGYNQIRHQISGRDNFDDPPLFQGQPLPSYIAKAAIAFKELRAPGQVTQVNWASQIGQQDDHPQWVGRPLSSFQTSGPATSKFYGAIGQVPTPEYSRLTTTDDPPPWYPLPRNIASSIIPLAAYQAIYRLPGQTPPFRPNVTYDDAAGWQWEPPPLNVTTHIQIPSLVQARSPFYVPRENDQPFWAGSPVNSFMAALAATGFNTFFGAAGQVPTRNWSSQQSQFDDSSTWLGASTNSYTIQLQNTLVKVGINQNRQQQSTWINDDPSIWVGASVGSYLTYRTTLQSFYGAPGQSPQNRYWPQLSYEDTIPWQPGIDTLNSSNVLIVVLTTYYGKPGQVVPARWQWLPDDSSNWNAGPIPGNPTFYYSQITFNPDVQSRSPFYVPRPDDQSGEWSAPPWMLSNNQVRIQFAPVTPGTLTMPATILWSPDDPDDASTWSRVGPNNALFNQNAPPTPHPSVHNLNFPQQNIDDSFWLGTPQRSVILPDLSSFGLTRKNGQAVQRLWTPLLLAQDDSSGWLGAPLPSKTYGLVLVTQIKMFGAIGQAPTKNWSQQIGAQDDSAPWMPPLAMLSPQTRNLRAQSVLIPPTILWVPDDPDEASIISAMTLPVSLALLTGPHIPPQRFRTNVLDVLGATDDPNALWLGMPQPARQIPILTGGPIYGQPGQVAPFRPNWTYDDATYWMGNPEPSYVIQALAANPFFGQGGQVVPFRWNFTLDDPPMFQGAPIPTPFVILNVPIVYPPGTTKIMGTLLWRPMLFNYDVGEAPGWVGAPFSPNYMLTTPAKPITKTFDWLDFFRRGRRRQ